jgi:hypothetical protein
MHVLLICNELRSEFKLRSHNTSYWHISLTMSSRVNDLIAYLSPKYVVSLCNFTENNIYYSFKLCFTMWKFDVYEHILNVLFIWKKMLKYFPGVYFFYLSFKSPEFTPVFSSVHVTRSLVLCVCFVDCCLSFCPFLLAIVLFVLRFTHSDYPFGMWHRYFITVSQVMVAIVKVMTST